MKYFIMSQDRRIKNRAVVEGQKKPAAYKIKQVGQEEEMPDVMAFRVIQNEGAVFLDLYEEPYYMVSESLYKVLVAYAPYLEARTTFLNNIEQGSQRVYYSLEKVGCLPPDGRMVFDQSGAGGMELFQIEGATKKLTVASLKLVESILRREFYGLAFQELECR